MQQEALEINARLAHKRLDYAYGLLLTALLAGLGVIVVCTDLWPRIAGSVSVLIGLVGAFIMARAPKRLSRKD